MRQQMIGQLPSLVVRFFTELTLVWLVFVVCAQVLVQCPVLRKGFTTCAARIGFFPCVNAHMTCEVLFLNKSLRAVLALVRFIAAVNHLVATQTKRRTKTFPTCLTGVKLVVLCGRRDVRGGLTQHGVVSIFQCMCLHVTLKGLLVLELCVAFVAAEAQDLGVVFRCRQVQTYVAGRRVGA